MFSMYILSLMHSITMWICFLRCNTLHERIYKSSFTLQLSWQMGQMDENVFIKTNYYKVFDTLKQIESFTANQ